MLRRTRLACLTVLLAAAAGSAAPVPGDSSPRYKFKEGETLKYVLEVAAKQEAGAGGGLNLDIDMSITIDLTWKVKKVEKDGSATLVQTFDRLRMKGDAAGQKIEYDTATGAAPDDFIGKQVAETM